MHHYSRSIKGHKNSIRLGLRLCIEAIKKKNQGNFGNGISR